MAPEKLRASEKGYREMELHVANVSICTGSKKNDCVNVHLSGFSLYGKQCPHHSV